MPRMHPDARITISGAAPLAYALVIGGALLDNLTMAAAGTGVGALGVSVVVVIEHLSRE